MIFIVLYIGIWFYRKDALLDDAPLRVKYCADS